MYKKVLEVYKEKRKLNPQRAKSTPLNGLFCLASEKNGGWAQESAAKSKHFVGTVNATIELDVWPKYRITMKPYISSAAGVMLISFTIQISACVCHGQWNRLGHCGRRL